MRILSLVALLLFPSIAFAHIPVLESADDSFADENFEGITLFDPTEQSIAAYGSLEEPGEVDVYRFAVNNTSTIPVEALVPVRVSNASFHPTVVVAAEGMPTYESNLFELPIGFGAIQIDPPNKNDRRVFFEPFSQERLFHGNEARIDVIAGEEYYVYVFEDQQQTGDYSLGIGTVENFEDVGFGGLLLDVMSLKLGLQGNETLPWLELTGFFILFAGFVIGLGAVTVIDLHGFLARKSSYWTQATIRSHKVTKPLIWIGISLVIVGGVIIYSPIGWTGLLPIQFLIVLILVLNGLFLSFSVSPYLLAQEKKKADKKLLPASLQRKITLSFLISFTGWWSLLLSMVWYLLVLR